MVALNNHNPPAYYYRRVRPVLAEHMRKGRHRVLDVGCGAGVFGEFLKSNGYASEVIGIEMNLLVADEASSRLDRVIRADLNRDGAEKLLKGADLGTFDYIVCGDVLEHLIDPWKALAELAAFLAPGGRMIASIPNVRHWSVLVPLAVFGVWEYKASGILDRTHMRFFTKAASLNLFRKAGLRVVACRPSIWWRVLGFFNFLSARLLSGFLANQWIIVGEKRDGTEDSS